MLFDHLREEARAAPESGIVAVANYGWGKPGLIPLWAGEGDLPTPSFITNAAAQALAAGETFYTRQRGIPELREALAAYHSRVFGKHHAPDEFFVTGGGMQAIQIALDATAGKGDEVIYLSPAWPNIAGATGVAGATPVPVRLTAGDNGWVCDVDAIEAAITPRTRIFVLCNPHNPVGRVFRRDELERMAEICQRHDLVICSDEIHCDLVFSPHEHVPIASLDPEIARRTITLIAPSKTFNIAGLEASVAIIEDEALRTRFLGARAGMVSWVNLMGQVATLAAYRDGGDWLAAAMRYLEGNRDYLAEQVANRLPGVRLAVPEATYLAWLDCRAAGIGGNAHEFFLEHARVALNDGATFGCGGEGFVRLNFGCPRSTLEEALARMEDALINR